MNVNDVIGKLKVMLSSGEVVETVETKMAEATLVDGTEVYTEGELETGAILFVRAGEGVSEDPFAPAGLHETTDGLLITVGENGEISSIEEAAAEVEAEKKEEEVEIAMEEDEEVKVEVKEKDFDMDELVEAIVEIVKPQGEVIEELKKELELLKERFNKVAGEPAAKPVRNTFSENKKTRDEMFAQRMDALASIRKNK
jgi:hypothetical protein